VGIVEPSADDGHFDHGIFDGDASSGTRLSNFPDQHPAPVDFFFAIIGLFG
jgi:hypothetical protein